MSTLTDMDYAAAAFLIACREVNGWSQADLARMLKTQQGTISRYEAGIFPVPFAVVLRLRALHPELHQRVAILAQLDRQRLSMQAMIRGIEAATNIFDVVVYDGPDATPAS